MGWFYEIRDTNNSVLKRDGGFADQDAAKTAARVDANNDEKLFPTRQAGHRPHLSRPKRGEAHAVNIAIENSASVGPT